MNNIHKLIGKIVFKAQIENTSPLLIANGNGEILDFEVIKDVNGYPFIPASGMAGMFRKSFEKIVFDDNLRKQFNYFWGSGKNENTISQSHIIIDDLKPSGFVIVERDGVAIDSVSNLAIDKSKFDYEIVEPGAKFLLQIEITLRKGFDKNTFLQFLKYIINIGESEGYQQGAFKSSGFGILKLEKPEIYVFDFPLHSNKWLAYIIEGKLNKGLLEHMDKIVDLKFEEPNSLFISGKFEIHNSLIIRSELDEIKSGKDNSPDKTHLKNSKNIPIISGKSIKGAIRHRAIKIVNTINNKNNKNLVNELFGFVDPKSKNAMPSRLKSFEVELNGVDAIQIQPRIKIDRFTGGTVEHALIQTQPIWHNSEKFTLKFEIANCKLKDAALLLLVMRDLMTGDLAIGGEKAIGRGTLKGKDLNFSGLIENKKINFDFNDKGISDINQINEINAWIEELNNK